MQGYPTPSNGPDVLGGGNRSQAGQIAANQPKPSANDYRPLLQAPGNQPNDKNLDGYAVQPGR